MITIRPATMADVPGKGIVHYRSYQQSYTGLISQAYLDRMTQQRCTDMAARFGMDNTFVAEDQETGRIVGFACYGVSSDEGPILLADGSAIAPSAVGELYALYLLQEYQGQGIGKALALACLDAMQHYSYHSLWVLQNNSHAIQFYRHLGFVEDKVTKQVRMGEPVTAIRMFRKHTA